ncbi:MFS transporter [Streptomyces diacarni]|uniref:MFS transporter n=1 Tax=Streptomyces diacarni TaxID=2800381 RepID=UPI0033F6D1C4
MTGQTASVAGSSVSLMVAPVLAVTQLDATTSEVAWLTFAGQLPPALLALHAGALADRSPKQKQMIAGDLVSAGAVATLPAAAALGELTLMQLMTVTVVQSAAKVLHDAAAISFLPSLVDRALVQRSNSRVGALFAVAATAGSHLGAALTALLDPARALLADVGSYLISASCTARIQSPPADEAAGGKRHLHREISAGLRYVHRDTRLATLTLVNASTSFALALLNTLWALYLLRTLAMSPTAFGVTLGIGTLGAVVGAWSAPSLARRFGPGPMMLTALALTPLTQIPVLLASPGLAWQVGIGAALVGQLACASAVGTTQRSIRQVVTNSDMQGRMQAASTWLTSSSRPLAALLAGALGTWLGVRPTLGIGACLLLIPLAVFARSSLRALREMPDPTPRPTRKGELAAPPPTPAPQGGPSVPRPVHTDEESHERAGKGDAP